MINLKNQAHKENDVFHLLEVDFTHLQTLRTSTCRRFNKLREYLESSMFVTPIRFHWLGNLKRCYDPTDTLILTYV